MTLLLVSFLAALVGTLLIIGSTKLHGRHSGDTEQTGPQKFHVRVVPRIGGLGIVGGVAVGLAWAIKQHALADMQTALLILAAGGISFAAGLAEDITKRVTPRQRMLAVLLSASLALWLADVGITRTDIPGLDPLLQVAGVSALLTLLAVSGVVNAVNIIDGFNGLASLCIAIMLAGLTWVAHQAGDTLVMQLGLIGLGAVLGFFLLNYPFGLVFLGDGGAYFAGFWVAELGLLLIQRNPGVSPMFPLLLCAYPIVETLFSMYRRKFRHGRPIGQPDATHLHSLVFRHLAREAKRSGHKPTRLRLNSLTSPHLWALCLACALPAVIFWNDSQALQTALLLFTLIYLALYHKYARVKSSRRSAESPANKPALDSAG